MVFAINSASEGLVLVTVTSKAPVELMPLADTISESSSGV